MSKRWRRPKVFSVRASEWEAERIRRGAETAGQSLSDFLRTAALRHSEHVRREAAQRTDHEVSGGHLITPVPLSLAPMANTVGCEAEVTWKLVS